MTKINKRCIYDNIYRYFVLLSFLILSLYSYASDFEVDGIAYNILTESINEVEVTLNNNNKMSGDGREQELTISANCKWTVSSDVNWLSVNSSSGDGNGSVTITASLNSTGVDRTGTITVRNVKQTLEKKVRVSQGTPTGAIVPTIEDNLFPE